MIKTTRETALVFGLTAILLIIIAIGHVQSDDLKHRLETASLKNDSLSLVKSRVDTLRIIYCEDAYTNDLMPCYNFAGVN